MVICTAHRARDVARMRLLLCAVLSHALVAPITRAPQRSTHLRAPPRRGTPLNSRLDDADALEIRLDVTVLWCPCLARELSRELATNPLKEVPGFTGADLRALGYCFASASCLSVLWVAAGLATRQFEPADAYGEGLIRVLVTSVVAGPLWLLVESALHVPVSYDTSLAHYSSSLFGLAATMALVRTVR